jgi:hypothetical protein
MGTTRTALAITVLAVAGLLVSVTAAWSQLTPGTSGRDQLGPPVARSEARLDASSADRGRPPSVDRASADLTSRQQQEARPTRVTMPEVGIDAAIRPVGVAADGQMQLPPDPRVLGWYRFGAAPERATRGSAVIAGHLDSQRFGLGPLVRLREVQTGDLVQVTLSDRSSVTYRVEAITRYDQEGLPDELFARSGAHRLQIITCGGDYVADAGGYQQNLVVTAVPA